MMPLFFIFSLLYDIKPRIETVNNKYGIETTLQINERRRLEIITSTAYSYDFLRSLLETDKPNHENADPKFIINDFVVESSPKVDDNNSIGFSEKKRKANANEDDHEKLSKSKNLKIETTDNTEIGELPLIHHMLNSSSQTHKTDLFSSDNSTFILVGARSQLSNNPNMDNNYALIMQSIIKSNDIQTKIQLLLNFCALVYYTINYSQLINISNSFTHPKFNNMHPRFNIERIFVENSGVIKVPKVNDISGFLNSNSNFNLQKIISKIVKVTNTSSKSNRFSELNYISVFTIDVILNINILFTIARFLIDDTDADTTQKKINKLLKEKRNMSNNGGNNSLIYKTHTTQNNRRIKNSRNRSNRKIRKIRNNSRKTRAYRHINHRKNHTYKNIQNKYNVF
jgi:hypothetical protein